MMRPVQGKTVIQRSSIHGWGVFATKDIKAGEIVEQMPALVIYASELRNGVADESMLATHAYEPVGLRETWIGTGTQSFYNSNSDPNATYEYHWGDDDGDWITITALTRIKDGQEITLHYGMK